MTLLKSLKTKLEELEEYRKFHDLPDWPDNFIGDMCGKMEEYGGSTIHFSGKQVEKIEQLHDRYVIRNDTSR